MISMDFIFRRLCVVMKILNWGTCRTMMPAAIISPEEMDGLDVAKLLSKMGMVFTVKEARRNIAQGIVTIDNQIVSSEDSRLVKMASGSRMIVRIGEDKVGFIEVT